MHRIDNDTVALSMPTPASPGPKPDGYFTYGTMITADWLNALQEEICYTITEAGFSLDKEDTGQLLIAINQIIADAGPIPPIGPGDAGELDTANYDVTSSTGNVVIRATGGSININVPTFEVPPEMNEFSEEFALLYLSSGSYIEGFADSTNYTDYVDDYDHYALTEAAIEAMVDDVVATNNIQYIFGAIDFNGDYTELSGETFYWWGYSYDVPEPFTKIKTNFARPFSAVIPGGATGVKFRILSFDVWVNVAPGSAETYTFTSNWAADDIVISDSDTHGSIGIQPLIDTPTDAKITVVLSSGAFGFYRGAYRMKVQSYPVY